MKIRILLFALLCTLFSFSSQAQTDCYRQLQDEAGMPIEQFKESLNSTGCQVREALPVNFQNDFAVYSFGFYTQAFGFDDKEYGYQQIFDRTKSMKVVPFSDYYMLIGKQSDATGIYNQFMLDIELPAIGPGGQALTESIEQAIEGQVLGVIDSVYNNGFSNSPYDYVAAENAGMIELAKIIGQLVDGEYGFDERKLELMGFELLLDQNFDLTRDGAITETENILDYTGTQLFLDGISLGLLKDDMENGFSIAADSLRLTVKAVVTDNQNYFSTSNIFETARIEYEQRINNIDLWVHVYEDVESNSVKIYAKYKIRVTNQEAEYVSGFVFRNANRNNEPSVIALVNDDCKFPTDLLGKVDHFLGKWTAKKCWVDSKNYPFEETCSSEICEYTIGVASGALDGVKEIVGLVKIIGESLWGVLDNSRWSPVYWYDVIANKYASKVSYLWQNDLLSLKNLYVTWEVSKLEKKIEADKYWKNAYEGVKKLFEAFDIDKIYGFIEKGIKDWFKDVTFQNGSRAAGYPVGKLIANIAIDYLTFGSSSAVNLAKGTVKLGQKGLQTISKFDVNSMKKVFAHTDAWAKNASKKIVKKVDEAEIKIGGCFVRNTPVLMANTLKSNIRNINFGNTAKTMAVAASMPIVAVPIQDVQLLDYVMVHEIVNEQNNFIASTDEDLYLGLLNKDSYTSNQQRERDKYELNDIDWYCVSFEQVGGTSKCHFALHDDWVQQQGYESEKVVILNLPEQGINGPFRITAIKHIIPQKKPEGDAGDGYDWKPVTGLFEHQSTQVYTIDFDNGESVGVTYQHPIFSATANDWKLAGELEISEEVLTKSGNAKVISSTKKEGQERVYNLEVKELHNFLVSESGVVVHNGCASIIAKVKKMTLAQLQQHIDDGWNFVIQSSDDLAEFFQTRRYFEELMVAYRYSKNGLKSTNPIAHNFKALDAFKETSRTVVNGITEITSSLAVSMKTTKVSKVSKWLSSNSSHLDDLTQGLSQGIQWAGHKINYSNVRLDIYMPKNVYSAAKKIEWESYIENLYPNVKVNVSRLEDHIKNF